MRRHFAVPRASISSWSRGVIASSENAKYCVCFTDPRPAVGWITEPVAVNAPVRPCNGVEQKLKDSICACVWIKGSLIGLFLFHKVWELWKYLRSIPRDGAFCNFWIMLLFLFFMYHCFQWCYAIGINRYWLPCGSSISRNHGSHQWVFYAYTLLLELHYIHYTCWMIVNPYPFPFLFQSI